MDHPDPGTNLAPERLTCTGALRKRKVGVPATTKKRTLRRPRNGARESCSPEKQEGEEEKRERGRRSKDVNSFGRALSEVPCFQN